MSDVRWELATGLSGIDGLATDWRRLAAENAAHTHVHLWEWQRSRLAHLEPRPDAAAFAVGRAAGEVIAILPLAKGEARIAGIPCATLGLPVRAELPDADLVVSPAWLGRLSLAGLLADLARLCGPFDALVFAARDDAAATSLVRAGRVPTVSERIGEHGALPAARLADLQMPAAADLLAILRKARAELDRSPGWQIVVARSPAALADAFVQLLTVEASGWKGRAGSRATVPLDARMCGFYRELVDRLGPRGQCEMRVLRVAGTTIAVQLSMLTPRRVLVLKTGRDQRHAALAPQHLLVEHLLASLAERPTIEHVELVDKAAWHADWAPEPRRVLQHHVFAGTMRARLASAALHGRQVLRPVRRLGGVIAPARPAPP